MINKQSYNKSNIYPPSAQNETQDIHISTLDNIREIFIRYFDCNIAAINHFLFLFVLSIFDKKLRETPKIKPNIDYISCFHKSRVNG